MPTTLVSYVYMFMHHMNITASLLALKPPIPNFYKIHEHPNQQAKYED